MKYQLFLHSVRKTIIIYGLSLAALTMLLKVLEYKYFMRDLSMEIYVAVIAIFFTIIGVWVGTKVIQRKQTTIVKEVVVPNAGTFTINEVELEQLNISPREYEVLEHMAKGLSNQEIADELYISLSTVKTHAANVYAKLDVKRRTQAIQRAKELQLIP